MSGKIHTVIRTECDQKANISGMCGCITWSGEESGIVKEVVLTQSHLGCTYENKL